MKNQRINFLSIFSLALITLTFILSYDYLINFGYGNFMEMYDNAAHLATMRGFYKVGFFSPFNYWLHPPAVFPVNYPPLFHTVGATLLNFVSMETISIFYFWIPYLIVMLVIFFSAKKITDVKGAFFTTLIIISFRELAEKSFAFTPHTLSICWGLLSFIYFKKNKFFSMIFLMFSLLTHLNGVLYLLAYFLYFLIDFRYLKELTKSFFKNNKLIKIGAVGLTLMLGYLWTAIFIRRLHFLKPQLSLISLLNRYTLSLVKYRDYSDTFLMIGSILGFIVLAIRKNKLYLSLFITNLILSPAIGGRISSFNVFIFSALLTGIFFRKLTLFFAKDYLKRLSFILCTMLSLSIVFFPSRDVTTLWTLRKSSFLHFLLPQLKGKSNLFFPMEERKEACEIIKKLSEIDDIVFVEGSLNTENFIFAFSGRVATNKESESLTPLLWLSKTKAPPASYRHIEAFDSGYALYMVKDKRKATKLTTKVIR